MFLRHPNFRVNTDFLGRVVEIVNNIGILTLKEPWKGTFMPPPCPQQYLCLVAGYSGAMLNSSQSYTTISWGFLREFVLQNGTYIERWSHQRRKTGPAAAAAVHSCDLPARAEEFGLGVGLRSLNVCANERIPGNLGSANPRLEKPLSMPSKVIRASQCTSAAHPEYFCSLTIGSENGHCYVRTHL